MNTPRAVSIIVLLLITVSAYAFQINFPNGGETLTQNVPTNVSFSTDAGDTHYRVHYTTDGGQSQAFIAEMIYAPVGLVVWGVNVEPGVHYRIRIEAWHITGGHWEGIPPHWVNEYGIRQTVMGGEFTVQGPDPQTVHVDSPNGGEVYTQGQTVSIDYSISGGAYLNCDIYLSTDGGATYPSFPNVAAGLLCGAGSCSFAWVPNDVTSNARIKIIKNLIGGGYVQDESDANFTIRTAYSVHVTYPNGGEQLSQHVPTNISWDIGAGNVYSFFRVYLRTDAQPEWQQLGSDINTPGMLWNVDHVPATGCRVKVDAYRLVFIGGQPVNILAASDESDNTFTIGEQTVHVDIPNGGESYLVGLPVVITYSVGGGGYVACEIRLSADGGASYPFLIDVVYSPGSPVDYSWPAAAPVTNTARIKVIKQLLDGTTIEDVSDANFSIVAAPSITVLSPDGVALLIGDAVEIQWNNQGGHVDSYSIDRSNDGGVTYPTQLVAGLSGNATSLNYVVQGPPSNSVKFRVTANYSGGALHVDDANDNNCTVGEANPIDPLKLELPSAVSLSQNHPNPFNPTTSIGFDLPGSMDVKLTVHNVLGQTVAVLVDGFIGAGKHRVMFDGANLPSGFYFYRLRTGTASVDRQMTLAK